MKIDRAIQQRILQKLYDAYPGGLYPLTKSIDEEIDELSVIANTQYLQDHGLVQSGFRDRNLVGVKHRALSDHCRLRRVRLRRKIRIRRGGGGSHCGDRA